MNNKCLVANHSNKNIITICLAAQCQGKRVCCSKCQSEFHNHHNIDQLVDIKDLLDFITTQSQKPNVPSSKIMQVIEELNNVLKYIDCLVKLIRQEIQRLSSINLQTLCKNLGNHYNIFTEQIGNKQWNNLVQEMLSHVELKEGEIIEKDQLVTHLGKPYTQFMKQFSQTLSKMVKELQIANQTMKSNQSLIDQNSLMIDQNQTIINQQQNLKDQQVVDPNPFSQLTELHILNGHTNQIGAMDICEQRSLLASGSRDGTVKLWDLEDNTLIKTFQNSSLVFDVVFSSKGSYLAYGGGSKIITLIEIKDLLSKDVVSELKGHQNSIITLTFSKDQRYLISGSQYDPIRIWNVHKKQEICKLQTGSIVYGLVLSSDNTLIVSHSLNTGIKIWDYKNERKLQQLCTHLAHPLGFGIIFSNDEKELISSGNDGKIKIWSLTELKFGKLLLIKEFKVASFWIQKVQMTSDSKFILFHCYKAQQVIVIDSNTGVQIQLFQLKNQITESSDYRVGGIAITKQIDMIAYADENELIVRCMKYDSDF